MKEEKLWVGIDVGSTTVKIAVVDPKTKELLYSDYQRHNAEQSKTVYNMLDETYRKFQNKEFVVIVCGSGGQSVAKPLNAFFIQEVIANSIIIRSFYKDVRVAIELGGQDAKVIFFRFDELSQQLVASDMRMNGSCAGGTGAFIDQVAELLHIKTEEFGGLADKGETVYDISGRCGVFAKTDIQPLLNQGISKEDIALSTFHAIAKQTIGGLAQGMDILPKVIFEGGPLTFNKRLIKVFQERLKLSDDDIVIPEKPEIMVAWGAALSIEVVFADKENQFDFKKSMQSFKDYLESKDRVTTGGTDKFFKDESEKEDFLQRHIPIDTKPAEVPWGSKLDVYLGIDAGSTTSKFALIDEKGEIVDYYYSNNYGDPLGVIQTALISMRDKYRERNVQLNIKGVGSTGYGEILFSKAFKADYHTVETVAHAEAAQKYASDVTFILDIGGQDMKAISLKGGIVTGIILNEACSAGCGSFIETYARSLNIAVEDIARLAFSAENPSKLGSRCTVFMNSSIITEQKNGKMTEEILAGIVRSIIENVFTKVVRISNLDLLGDVIVVQGGTFKNDAVLRAMEQYTGRTVIRPPYCGIMGAIGIALLTKKNVEQKKEKDASYVSTFIGLDKMDDFYYTKNPGMICTFCQNNCNRTMVEFNDGSRYITGNRCERGEIIGDISSPEVKNHLKKANKKMQAMPDMMKLHNQLLFADYHPKQILPKRKVRIGIPRTLEFWVSLPFWKTVFTALGFEVVVSRKSSYEVFENGLHNVPSDTVCFPAKLAHGHIQDLIMEKVDRIFMPMMIRVLKENPKAQDTHVCTIVQGYPMIIAKSDEPTERFGIPFDHPTFHWMTQKIKEKQTVEYFINTFPDLSEKDIRKAIKEGDRALKEFEYQMRQSGKEIIASLKKPDEFAIVLAGRPYHSDELVNHNLSSYFTRLGIPVITLDALPDLNAQDLKYVRMETTIPFHTRMAGAALAIAKNPHLELVQIVSFGCGHDAVITDEIIRLMRMFSDKEALVLKLDEGENQGPLNIRIKSFVETIRNKREKRLHRSILEDLKERLSRIQEAFPVKFTKQDKPKKTILAPNLSHAFSILASAVIGGEGYKILPMPLADERAIELGKKYVHNDICFPAQVNIGESLAFIERGSISPDELAIGLAKNCDDCRAGQYSTLARKALDEAGYPQIPIITTGADTKNMHPGFRLGIKFQLRMLWGITMVDSLELMRRRIRPYEAHEGETNKVFDRYLKKIVQTLMKSRDRALQLFRAAIKAFNKIETLDVARRPRAGIIGEILLNFHPVSNANMETYLESHGMEVILPTMLDFFRRMPLINREKARRQVVPNAFISYMMADLEDKIYNRAHKKISEYMKEFRFHEEHTSIYEIMENIDSFMDTSYAVGEGWLIPGEISAMAEHGVNSFVIVQPFGCLPNHITGRGMIKALKKIYPHIQIISLDFDPDTAIANIENRLQMLIITAKELDRKNREELENAPKVS